MWKSVLLLRDLIRWREWYDSKLPVYLVGMFYVALREPDRGAAQLRGMAELVVLLGLYAAFGHIVNDYSDRDADRAAGKKRVIAAWSERRAIAAMVLPGLGVACLAIACFDRSTQILAALALLSAVFYSLPPVRLKERGAFGLSAAALAQRTLPLAIAFQALDGWDGIAAALCALSTLIGFRFIIVHQLLDRANDRRAGIRTSATEHNPRRLMKLLQGLFAAEIICACGTITAMCFTVPALAAPALVYAAVILVSWRSGRPITALSYFVFSSFYCVIWPTSLAVLLSLRQPKFLPALLLSLMLSAHQSKVRTRVGLARFLTESHRGIAAWLAERMRRFPGVPRLLTSAVAVQPRRRAIAAAISDGVAALARMQLPDGSFPLFTGTSPDSWQPCGRLFSTAYIMMGAGSLLPAGNIARAVEFIRAQRRTDGLWEYDSALGIPPDVDSTACSLAALALHGRKKAELHAGPALLRSYWRRDNGPFQTWKTPDMWSAPPRDDAVVNCNVLFALRLLGAPATAAEQAAVQRFVRTSRESRYYCSPTAIAHAARRAGFDRASLPPPAAAPPNPRDLLGCAQWLCGMGPSGLADIGPGVPLAAGIFAAQQADGAWPLWPWIMAEELPKPFWGSAAVTTALAVEALTVMSGTGQN